MDIRFSEQPKGILGVSGHVGVGHVHSHSGFVQDDSAGLAVAVRILKQALPVDTGIACVQVSIEDGILTVFTNGGGAASAAPRRGIAPYEKELLESRAIGLDASFSQNAAVRVFGRLYGQGVCETAAAFHVSQPAARKGYLDRSIATVLDVDGIPVALQLLVNFTEGGIGPAEDYEGNVPWDFKEPVMKAVGLDTAPTVVLESKAYIPAFASGLEEDQLMIRAQQGVDLVPLGRALLESALQHGIPACLKTNAMPLVQGGLAKATAAFADRVIALAEKLKTADDCLEKVQLTADLAELISQDAGGVTFMGNTVNDQMRGAGVMPGSGVILSMIVTTAYKKYVKIPMLTPEDADRYMLVALDGLRRFHEGA